MKQKIISLIGLALILALSLNVNAQHDCKSKSSKEQCCIPDLTDDQTAKIKKIKTAYLKDVMQLKNQLAEKKAHQRTLMTVDKPDVAAIDKTIDEIGALKIEMMKKEAKHKVAVRALLTDEQKLAFDMNHSKGYRKCGGHGNNNKSMKHKCSHGKEQKCSHK
jgi:Spy/CpxP family protein refolding chaperone